MGKKKDDGREAKCGIEGQRGWKALMSSSGSSSLSILIRREVFLREEGTDFWPINRFFFIVLNYFLAFSLPKNLFPMSKFSYNYLM